MRRALDKRKKKDTSIRRAGLAARVAQHPWVECETGKVTYRSWDEADLAAFTSQMYFYRCPKCQKYHLTQSRQKAPPRPEAGRA